MSEFRAPPRTVSSGTPVAESRLEDLRRGLNRAGAASRSPARSPGTASPPPPSPPPAPEKPEQTASSAPQGISRVYSVGTFNRIGDDDLERLLPEALKSFTAKLWPEGVSRPLKVPSRDGFAAARDTSRRIVKERRLENQVLGILGRLTPENYDKMKQELFDLPIRQSTDEEITEVVQKMYTTAVNPQQEIYTELYAKLMADLVQHTGVQGVGKTIRKAIIDKCQQQFEQPFRLSDEDCVDAEGKALPANEIDEKKVQLKAKLRCNIKFLGHIFISGMVNEKVVNFVLFYLLYGRETEQRKKRRPEEYELEMFCDLLKKVVKTLSAKTHSEYIPGYMKSLDNLTEKVSPRIRFMLMDMKELYQNNWEDKRRSGATMQPTGPMKLEEFERREAEIRTREQQEFERAAQMKRYNTGPSVQTSSPKTPAPRAPEIPLPKKEEIYEVIESYKSDKTPSVLEAFFKPIPAKERASYLSTWLQRILKVVRKDDERKMVGEVFDTLKNSQLFTVSELEKIVFDLGTYIVVERIYDDSTKLWQCWAELVNSSTNIGLQEAHTFLLRALVRGGMDPTPSDQIVGMVTAVLKAPDNGASQRTAVRRFRPLPAILQYANPLPDADADDGEVDDDPADDDLLAQVVEVYGGDPEIAVFDNLLANVPPSDLTSYIKTDPSRGEGVFAAKVASAIFTYVRCDPQCQMIDNLKEPLKELARAQQGNDAIIVAESYMTAAQLTFQPENGLKRYIERLKALEIISQASVEAAAKLFDGRQNAEFSNYFSLAAAPGPRVAPQSAPRGPMPRRGGR